MVDKKLLKQEELQEALLAKQNGSDEQIGQYLVKKGLLKKEDMLSALADQYGIIFHKKI